MSVLKYTGEASDDRGNPLQWPGIHGVPLRGPVGLLKNEELDEFVEEVHDFHCEELDMHKPEDKEKYTEIKDRVLGNRNVLLRCDHVRGEDGSHKIWVEWATKFNQVNPRAMSRCAPGDQHCSSIKRVG